MAAGILLFIALSASPAVVGKQGLPIIQNPDTLVTEATGFSMAAMGTAVDEVLGLDGGHFGVAVKDFSTGETITRNEGRRSFDIGSPELILTACAFDLESRGIVRFDTLTARDENFEDQLTRSAHGDIETMNKVYSVMARISGVEDWLAAKEMRGTEYSGVQLLWPGAPEIDENTSTPADCMSMLAIIESSLGDPDARRICRSPFTRTGLEDIQSAGIPVYGVCTRGETGLMRAAVAFLPGDRHVGIVVMGDDLCCPEKADLAFRMLWDALQ